MGGTCSDPIQATNQRLLFTDNVRNADRVVTQYGLERGLLAPNVGASTTPAAAEFSTFAAPPSSSQNFVSTSTISPPTAVHVASEPTLHNLDQPLPRLPDVPLQALSANNSAVHTNISANPSVLQANMNANQVFNLPVPLTNTSIVRDHA